MMLVNLYASHADSYKRCIATLFTAVEIERCAGMTLLSWECALLHDGENFL